MNSSTLRSTNTPCHAAEIAPTIYSFGSDQQNELYVCCANGIVYRFNKSDLVGVNNNLNIVPENFSLDQNYPNPFNPTTSIKYSVPELLKVKLSVFDITGKEINTLVNEKQSIGRHEIKFNAADLSSGIYFYELNTGSFREVKRMVLVK